MKMYYEAIDIEKESYIYSGYSKGSLICELLDYIEFQNHINESLISESCIRQLDIDELQKIGIKIYDCIC